MLVLTRGEGESVKIGDEIEVVVLEIRGGKIRLGVRAPASVAVSRPANPQGGALSLKDVPALRR